MTSSTINSTGVLTETALADAKRLDAVGSHPRVAFVARRAVMTSTWPVELAAR